VTFVRQRTAVPAYHGSSETDSATRHAFVPIFCNRHVPFCRNATCLRYNTTMPRTRLWTSNVDIRLRYHCDISDDYCRIYVLTFFYLSWRPFSQFNTSRICTRPRLTALSCLSPVARRRSSLRALSRTDCTGNAQALIAAAGAEGTPDSAYRLWTFAVLCLGPSDISRHCLPRAYAIKLLTPFAAPSAHLRLLLPHFATLWTYVRCYR